LRVIKSNDFIAQVNLNIQGMVKNSRLAKSINDVAWSTLRQSSVLTLRQRLEYFGFKYGKATVAVASHNTSQNCSNCGQKVPKSLSTRTPICPHCGYVEDRDINAAINILKRGLSTVGHTETSYAWGEIPSDLVGYVLSG
jgi:transposase